MRGEEVLRITAEHISLSLFSLGFSLMFKYAMLGLESWVLGGTVQCSGKGRREKRQEREREQDRRWREWALSERIHTVSTAKADESLLLHAYQTSSHQVRRPAKDPVKDMWNFSRKANAKRKRNRENLTALMWSRHSIKHQIATQEIIVINNFMLHIISLLVFWSVSQASTLSTLGGVVIDGGDLSFSARL